jgi:hypothetical protein
MNYGTQVAGVRTISVPQASWSRNAGSGSLVRHGTRGPDVHCDRRSQQLGDSEFPAGTKIEGVISKPPLRTATSRRFSTWTSAPPFCRRTRYALRGELIGLDQESCSDQHRAHHGPSHAASRTKSASRSSHTARRAVSFSPRAQEGRRSAHHPGRYRWPRCLAAAAQERP